MANIIKKSIETETILPPKRIKLSKYLKELKKVSNKCIGLTRNVITNEITNIIVDETATEEEIKQLNDKLTELLADTKFGESIPKKSLSERITELETSIQELKA